MTARQIPKNSKPGDTITLFDGTRLTMDANRYWHDEDGTCYGFADRLWATDTSDQAGAGFSRYLLAWLPKRWRDALNGAAAAHDQKYSSPAYQASHERSEADADLERDVVLLGGPRWLGRVARWFSSVLGSGLWERTATRWRKRPKPFEEDR